MEYITTYELTTATRDVHRITLVVAFRAGRAESPAPGSRARAATRSAPGDRQENRE